MKQSLLLKFIGVGFALLFVFLHGAQAATFDIPCGDTSALISAINVANANGVADTINLAADCTYTFTSGDATNDDSALPRITTPIVINGNGATIERADGAPTFRLLYVANTGSLTLDHLMMCGGSATIGGGILNDGGTLTVTNSTLAGNHADDFGGGIYIEDGTVTVVNSTLSGNSATGTGGGIAGGNLSSTVTVIDSIFSENSAGAGGGMAVLHTLILINNTITGNTASSSGGGLLLDNANATVVNNLITGNSAINSGGGIYIFDSSVTLTNSTIAGNTAIDGGGIYNSFGTLTVANSIAWGNSTQISTQFNGTTNVTYSVVQDGFGGTGNLDFNPLFVSPVAHTSAPTTAGDYHIQSDSPAMNAGNSAALPPDTHDIDSDGNTIEPLPTDIDRDWRILDGVVDMGADEASGCTAYTSPYTVAAGDSVDLVRAIQCANLGPGLSVINLTNSTYSFTLGDVTNPDSALPRITTPITINGNGATLQRQSGNPNFRLILISDTGILTLKNVTINGGRSDTYGGGIYIAGGILTVTNTTFSANDANSMGGGIYNTTSGTLTVSNSVFSGNSTGSYGGAIRSDGVMTVTGTIFTGNTAVGTITGGGAISNNGTVTISGSTFSGNSSKQNGGAIISAIGTTTIIDSVFNDNHAALSGGGSGGGIASSGGTMTVIDSIVTGNSAIAGGGISSVASTLIVTGSTISGNTAVNRGGGITTSTGTLALTNSAITGNRTTAETSTANGGGIYNHTSTATLINSLITGNATSSLSSGGGIYNQTGLTVINSTIAANNAASGREIYNSVTLTITNSIVWGSSSPISGQPATVTYSNVQGGYTGTGNLNVDPLFLDPEPFTSAPTTAGDYRLAAGSPSLNVGSNAALPADTYDLDGDGDTTEMLPIDFSGNPRIVNATVDIGAYEHQTAAGVTVSKTDVAVAEGGDTDNYTVRLDSRPATDVTLTITTGGQVTVEPVTLTFAPSDWSTEQTVIVTAVDDVLSEGTHSDTISHVLDSDDAAYHEFDAASVSVTVEDNDMAGVSVTPTVVSAVEGGATGTYSIVLTSKPTADVTVTPAGDLQCTVSAPLTFTSADWDTPQPVTVTAIDDAAAEGDHTCTITHSAVSGDLNYNGTPIASVAVTVKDNDVSNVLIEPTTLAVTEGGATSAYTIALASEPTGDVTITVSDDSQCDVSPMSLTFDGLPGTEWFTPQTITVTTVDDQDAESSHTCIVTHSATSFDPNYNSLTIPGVTVNISDNEFELLTNGGFEVYDEDKLPEGWTVKHPTGDKVKCDKVDKTFSFTGECAFKFKGGSGEKAKLVQNVSLNGVTLGQNDTLNLSAYFKGSNAAVKATFILSVTYIGNPQPVKVKMPVGLNAAYTKISVPELSIGADVVQQIKVMIKHKSTAGKLFVDSATLSLAAGSALWSNILPPPEAPDGFRGSN